MLGVSLTEAFYPKFFEGCKDCTAYTMDSQFSRIPNGEDVVVSLYAQVGILGEFDRNFEYHLPGKVADAEATRLTQIYIRTCRNLPYSRHPRSTDEILPTRKKNDI